MIRTVIQPETPGKHAYNINIKYERQGTCLSDIYSYSKFWIKKIKKLNQWRHKQLSYLLF